MIEDNLDLRVAGICNAYESGFGHHDRDLINPYPEGSDEYLAYAYGKEIGAERQKSSTAPPPGWLNYDTFEDGYEGWCWVVYKGRVVEAYRDHQYKLRFGKHSQNSYLRECVTHIMLWPQPLPPKLHE